MGERRDLYFSVLNRNPVPVTLRGWGSNLTGSLVEMMGVAPGAREETVLRRSANFSQDTEEGRGLKRRLLIPPDHYMVFRVAVSTAEEGEEEREVAASVFVDTDYHAFRVKFRFAVAKGSIATAPKDLTFEHAFPVSIQLKKKLNFVSGNRCFFRPGIEFRSRTFLLPPPFYPFLVEQKTFPFVFFHGRRRGGG